VISTYRFAGGASPATVPRASLPVLPKAAYAAACDLFDEIAAAAGFIAVKAARNSRGEAAFKCFELDDGTEIETHDWDVMTVAELEHLMRGRRAHANAASTLRCSGSFHDPTRARTDSHLIGWGRYGLSIYDTAAFPRTRRLVGLCFARVATPPRGLARLGVKLRESGAGPLGRATNFAMPEWHPRQPLQGARGGVPVGRPSGPPAGNSAPAAIWRAPWGTLAALGGRLRAATTTASKNRMKNGMF
jgi:hypothetical protein